MLLHEQTGFTPQGAFEAARNGAMCLCSAAPGWVYLCISGLSGRSCSFLFTGAFLELL